MSDIKYILAGDDDGEHTRFGCLSILRYAVAAVVTVLAITVIALVIHAVLRSEDVGLSVNKGYIGADALWSSTTTTTSSRGPTPTSGPEIGTAKLSRRRGLASLMASSADESDVYTSATIQTRLGSRALPKECFLGCSGGDDRVPTQVAFEKAKQTNLRVILIANNPGGRTKIDCNGTTVSLFDVQEPYGVIGSVALANFTVPPLTTITLQKRLRITDTSYIWAHYHLASRFSVRVQVTSSVTSYPLGKKGKTVLQNYTCEPVTIGLIDYEAIYASDHVECTAAISG